MLGNSAESQFMRVKGMLYAAARATGWRMRDGFFRRDQL
jgi:hypothetical protein